jgi:adenylate cyclase
MFDYQNRWSDDSDGSLALSKHYAEQAIEKNPNEPLARVVTAMVATRNGDFERATSEVQIALSLNPNFALAYNVLGAVRSYSGQPLEAIPMIERAIRLDPAQSEQYIHFLGMAYLLAGKYETAATHFRERIRLVPGTDFSRASLASALGHLGEIDEARRIWHELMEINAKYLFSEHFGRLPFKRPVPPRSGALVLPAWPQFRISRCGSARDRSDAARYGTRACQRAQRSHDVRVHSDVLKMKIEDFFEVL